MTEDLNLYIRLVYFALEKEKNNYFDKQDLTASQGDILLYLGYLNKRNKEASQKDIEKHFRLTNPTVTGLLNRLEEKGFVERKKSAEDGRTNLIHLTDKSLAMLKRSKLHKDEIERKLFHNFDESEQKLFINQLKKLLENLKDEDNQ